MPLQLFKRKPFLLLYVLGAALLLVTGGLWAYKQTTDPERVFWATLEQGMRTRGVTIKAAQKNPNATIEQTLQYALGGDNRSYSRTTLTQTGTTVMNEMIGTTGADYTRYVSIKTDQKGADGKDLDFSKIIGVWAKNDQPQLFSQAVLGTGLPLGGMVLPIASVGAEQRDTLLREIREANVYKIDFAKVERKRVDGRMQYTYDATIKPMAYARLMKQFAQSVGLHDFDQLDPNSYNGQPDLSLKLTVDTVSRHLVRVALPQNNYQQTYSTYDVPVAVTTPKQHISASELQERLRSL